MQESIREQLKNTNDKVLSSTMATIEEKIQELQNQQQGENSRLDE